MLHLGIDDIQDGMIVAASVFHPKRPELELLKPGSVFDRSLIFRMHQLGVQRIWVEHEIGSDLDNQINPKRSKACETAFHQLKHDFNTMTRRTITTGDIATYRTVVNEIILELTGHPRLSHLTEALVMGQPQLFSHGANVALLAVQAGLELMPYITQCRDRVSAEYAQDLTALGLGAVLHDIGKLDVSAEYQSLNILTRPKREHGHDEAAWIYEDHALAGYRMLRATRLPATASQTVLNHHQRWDGSGFPDMAEATEGRIKGTQAGEKIHIFSRIVGAADLLENLLTEQKGRPLVGALSAFNRQEYDDWFDPMVRDTLLKRIPPFPVGSHVTLNDQRHAVVLAPNMRMPCRPAIRIVDERDLRNGTSERSQDETLDLSLHPEFHIQTHAGLNVEPYLYELNLKSRDQANRETNHQVNKPDAA